MRSIGMKTACLMAVGAIAGTVGAGHNAQAEGARVGTVMFWDAAAGSKRAKLGAWGNGETKTSRDIEYQGGDALQVTTRGAREGISFALNPPLDIEPYKASGFLRFRLRFKSVGPPMGMGMGMPGMPGMPEFGGDRGMPPGYGGGPPPGYGGPPPGYGGPPTGDGGGQGFGRPNMRGELMDQVTPALVRTEVRPQFGGGPGFGAPPTNSGGGPPPGFGGGQPGYGGPPPGYGGPPPGYGGPGGYPGGGRDGMPPGYGGDGMFGMPVGPPPQRTEIKTLMTTLVLERGIMSGTVDIDLNDVEADEEGWRLFVLPLRDLRATNDAGGSLERVILTSDKEDTFYIGQVALVIETGEMTVSIRRAADPPGTQAGEITVAPGPLTLVADVEAGTADPIVEWNFDADNVGNLPAPGGAPGMPGMPGAGYPGAGYPGGGYPGGGYPGGGYPGGGEGAPYGGMPPGMPPMGMPGAGPGMGPGGMAAPTGPRIDARGMKATFDYPAEDQNYRVEATVRDRLGKKQPVKASVRVIVRG